MQENENTKWKRNAGFFIAGQFVSMFGSMLVSHAVTWHVTLEEKSGLLIALFTCAIMLPMVFISPFAGVWADRYNRKHLINISDAAIAIVTLVTAVVYSLGMRSILLLIGVMMVRSIGQGIQQPSVNALIPQIVPPEHLMRFNGIQSAAQSVTMFASPMAAGALLFYFPIQYIFFVDVITAIVGISTVFFCVKVTHTPKPKEEGAGAKAYYREMAEGVRFIKNEAWLKTLFVASAVFMVLAAPSAMMTPLQVARSFGSDVWRLPSIEIAFSSGMMLGGIVIAAWGGFKNKTHTMILAWVFFGLTTLLFGVTTNFWLYLAVMILCGTAMPFYNTPAMSLMQTKIPPELMGRVFSVLSMISSVAMPLGAMLFGPLADAVKIEILLIITGVLLLAGAFVFSTRKEMIEVGKAPEA
ncbi:MAG: MFS transporter [Clostridiales bacterium]|jgi:DHA3 family macrolide efflux protein-like MFS transporter|nr:MFS transporter [Clostridiales bacterium]